MRIYTKFALAALLASAPAFHSVGLAQGAAPAAAATTSSKVGVVDVRFIFENHPTMKTQIQSIDAEIKKAEDEINARRETVLKEIDQLRNFREDSAEYKQLEEKIAKMEADLKLEFMRKEKEFAEAKAKIILDAYNQVQSTVKAVAQHNSIDLVMRYSQEEMDPKKPATVTGGINRDIVYFNPNVDMTQIVMKLLTQQTASSGAAPQQAGATPPVRR